MCNRRHHCQVAVKSDDCAAIGSCTRVHGSRHVNAGEFPTGGTSKPKHCCHEVSIVIATVDGASRVDALKISRKRTRQTDQRSGDINCDVSPPTQKKAMRYV